ncbi:MAG: TonB-dependent siderophore receptor [Gammaproteobacteria bacterium]
MEQQFGSFDLYRTTADATGPIASDASLRYRFNLEYLDRNSFRDFAFTDRILVAPSLSWNLGDRTQFDLDFFYSDEDTLEDHGVPAIGDRPASIPTTRFLGEPSTDKSNTELTYLSATLNHKFNDYWNVRAKFVRFGRDGVDRQHNGIALDELTGDLNRVFFGGEATDDSHFGTLDVTGNVTTWGAEHKVLVGWDYYNIDTEVEASRLLAGSINIFNPLYGASDIDLPTLQKNRFIDQRIDWTVCISRIRSLSGTSSMFSVAAATIGPRVI